MSLGDRDRKLLMGLVPIIVLAAYWFLLLSPKMKEADTAQADVTEQQQRRDAAQAVATQATADQNDFAADYGEVIRLGKAIPAQVDMPSLLVQLDRAAEGTDIKFTKITAGERTAATTATPTAPPPAGEDSSSTPTDAGGTAAQSAPGQAAESANGAAATSDQRNAAAESSGVDAADTQTSTTTSDGSLPVGGGATTPSASGAPAAGALETVPLELEFVGNFFSLADFFHDIKRFVHVLNTDVVVNGRLVTIETVNFSSDQTIFPRIKAELGATVYLAPAAEGETAGATPAGPGNTTTPAGTPPTEDGTSPAPVAAAPLN